MENRREQFNPRGLQGESVEPVPARVIPVEQIIRDGQEQTVYCINAESATFASIFAVISEAATGIPLLAYSNGPESAEHRTKDDEHYFISPPIPLE